MITEAPIELLCRRLDAADRIQYGQYRLRIDCDERAAGRVEGIMSCMLVAFWVVTGQLLADVLASFGPILKLWIIPLALLFVIGWIIIICRSIAYLFNPRIKVIR